MITLHFDSCCRVCQITCTDLLQIPCLAFPASRQTSELSITTWTRNSLIIYKHLAIIAPLLSCRISSNLCRSCGFVLFTRSDAVSHVIPLSRMHNTIPSCTCLSIQYVCVHVIFQVVMLLDAITPNPTAISFFINHIFTR